MLQIGEVAADPGGSDRNERVKSLDCRQSAAARSWDYLAPDTYTYTVGQQARRYTKSHVFNNKVKVMFCIFKKT
jgi:hypothetical protein